MIIPAYPDTAGNILQECRWTNTSRSLEPHQQYSCRKNGSAVLCKGKRGAWAKSWRETSQTPALGHGRGVDDPLSSNGGGGLRRTSDKRGFGLCSLPVISDRLSGTWIIRRKHTGRKGKQSAPTRPSERHLVYDAAKNTGVFYCRRITGNSNHNGVSKRYRKYIVRQKDTNFVALSAK